MKNFNTFQGKTDPQPQTISHPTSRMKVAIGHLVTLQRFIYGDLQRLCITITVTLSSVLAAAHGNTSASQSYMAHLSTQSKNRGMTVQDDWYHSAMEHPSVNDDDPCCLT